MRHLRPASIDNKKGVATILIAGALLFFLLGFLVVGIDFAYMYYVRGQLQNAADAAALAGAAKLNISGDITQTDARNAAQALAAANTAAGQGVQVELNSGNVYSVNTADTGDIVVGHWDGTTGFNPAVTPINAIQVVARRTIAPAVSGVKAGGNPVGLIFRKVLAGWTTMSAAGKAIAVRVPLGAAPLALCTGACTPPTLPALFDVQTNLKTGDPGSEYGLAWTTFESVSSVSNTKLVDLINNRTDPGLLCGPAASCVVGVDQNQVTTNNGVMNALDDLGTKFRDPGWDSGNKVIVGGVVQSWNVRIIILDFQCNDPVGTMNACPPYEQGKTEPYHVAGWAKAVITNVCDNTNQKALTCVNTQGAQSKGVVISEIGCTSCGGDISSVYSGNAQLVK
jgi:Flp pilus assembly protein TadG